jgi:hypothetical protein
MISFYVLKPAGGMRFGTRWAYGEEVDPVVIGEGDKCPVCGRPVGALRWLPPHRVRLSSAKPEKWGDFVWGAGFDVMVSARLKLVYETEHLTGISIFHPAAKIVSMGRTRDMPSRIPTYHPIEILWNGANQDDTASGVTFGSPVHCSYCRAGGLPRRQSKLAIDERSWTGADIFTPRGAPVPIMVSEHFKQVFEAYDLRNAWFVPADRYAYDDRHLGLWYVRDDKTTSVGEPTE